MEANAQHCKILALSGGGFRGLYTARVLADLEQEIKAPIGRKFDLVAGTSIGGILALALACEIPVQRIVDLFLREGESIFKKRRTFFGYFRAPYDKSVLRVLLEDSELFGDRLLGDVVHPVLIPAINFSTGKPVVFKSPHHPTFRVDHKRRIVDVALATSAAPFYFARHSLDSGQYVDGGLFANAPGLLAVHEAEIFLGRSIGEISLMSVGTMSSLLTVDPSKDSLGGLRDWGNGSVLNAPRRLFNLAISAQESLTDFMLKQRLADRYVHVDDVVSPEKTSAVALDRADRAARDALISAAGERAKICLGDPRIMSLLEDNVPTHVFYYGRHARQEQ